MTVALKDLNWYVIGRTMLVPLSGALLALSTPFQTKTALWATLYYFLTGVGITAGYHRLWAHQSYKAGTLAQCYLLFGGAASFQSSALRWASTHRVHHRYVDTEQDPHSVNQGLWHAHMGWLLVLRKKPLPAVDVADLTANKLVMWQHRHYELLSWGLALVLPTVVAGWCWGDWRGGYAYAGALRICFLQQGINCINSLAHWLGEHPYDDKHSPRDHIFTALVTFGEGYHNFHHEFPTDYRNGVKWYQYDPSKWFIYLCSQLNLTSHLGRSSDNVIGKGEYQQQSKKLESFKSSLEWPLPKDQLPKMTLGEFGEAVDGGRHLVCIGGIVHDIEEWRHEHPGGKAVIGAYVGRDATKQFNGGVYEHSNAAHNLLDDFRVAALVDADETDI